MAPPVLTVMTPTADQPTGFALCERWMARQTIRGGPMGVQWIVVDDGETPVAPTQGQTYVRRRREPGCTGAQSLCRNLLAALPHVQGPIVAVVEHDDWYAPTHLSQLVLQLAAGGRIAGDDHQRYYHVPSRRWRLFENKGASLCQTAFRVELLPLFERIVREQLAQNAYGVDGHFWAAVPRDAWRLERAHTVVGIKGLPGRVGLGIGHRQYHGWTHDATGAQLRAWVGAEADDYFGLVARAA